MSHRRTTTVTAAAVLAGLLVLGPATTARAHGDSIRLTVGVSAGHPVTSATWENDGDPVDEDVAGTVTATATDGTTLGPWRFVKVPGKPGTFTTAEALPAGSWTITAQTAFPALGRAESRAEVTAASPAAPAARDAAGPAAGPAAAPSAAPRAAASSGGGTGPGAVTLGVTAAALALAGGCAALWLRRRARRS
ncbi:hypothetical protein GCM10010218_56110 [Streptomyces mashuensis]|uniref:Uncharacterized protein n=1 Tax=Streptomyces mashuensis TaxID=33904 RepID=A0A919B9L2_9ACTN|nr:hypothetical protein [Streptomyces mashuensis]GHF67405.1 hypothetical protein GCM10010218_56110 [Streptomyces mashuensis]